MSALPMALQTFHRQVWVGTCRPASQVHRREAASEAAPPGSSPSPLRAPDPSATPAAPNSTPRRGRSNRGSIVRSAQAVSRRCAFGRTGKTGPAHCKRLRLDCSPCRRSACLDVATPHQRTAQATEAATRHQRTFVEHGLCQGPARPVGNLPALGFAFASTSSRLPELRRPRARPSCSSCRLRPAARRHRAHAAHRPPTPARGHVEASAAC